jgi:DNA repair protein RadD
LLDKLDIGEIKILANCNVLSEGWDQPSVKCLIDCAPTKSLARFIQRAGRILRPYGPVEPLILDHAGNVLRHGMPDEERIFDLEGEHDGDAEADIRIKTCPKCFAIVRPHVSVCECGFVFAELPPRALPKQAAGELVEHDRRAAPVLGEDRAFFDTMLRVARSKGLKKGFVSYKFKEKWGRWPPYEWWVGVAPWPLRGSVDAFESKAESRLSAMTEAGYTVEPEESEHAFSDLLR